MFSTKLRKTLAVVASATLLCTSLTACNRDSGGNNAAGDSANKSITFALSTQANSFMVKMREGAQKKADELGLTINFQDASDDSATQANQLANAAATGAGAVIVNPTDSDAMAPAVKQLTDAKIPVVASTAPSITRKYLPTLLPTTWVAVSKPLRPCLRQSMGRAKSWCCKARPAPQPPGNGARASTKV